MTKDDALLVLPSEYEFKRYPNHDRGVWVSELLPHTARVVKDLCVIHSVHTEAINQVWVESSGWDAAGSGSVAPSKIKKSKK